MGPDGGRPPQLVRIVRRSGELYVVYHGSIIPAGGGHASSRWYVEPWPVPLGYTPGESYATAEEAERSIRGDA